MDPQNPAAPNGENNGEIATDNPQMAEAIEKSNRIDTILANEPANISPEDRAFLEANQNLLAPDEIQKVGLGQPANPAAPRQPQPQVPQPGQIRTRGIEMPKPAAPAAGATPPAGTPPPAGEIPEYVTQMYDQLADIQAETELRGVLSTDPSLKAIEPTIREYMKHPAYKQVPVEMIAKMLRPDPVAPQVQQQQQQNVQQVQQSRTPGRQVRSANGGAPNYATMDDNELENLANQVKSGVRIPTA